MKTHASLTETSIRKTLLRSAYLVWPIETALGHLRLVVICLACSILAILSMFITVESARASGVGSDCDGRLYDIVDHGELARFDSELRHALKHSDATQLAVLVSYPLRVNGPGSNSIEINDPTTLQNKLHDIFTSSVKAAVLGTSRKQVSCMSTGIMYGNGAIWVQPAKIQGAISYRIQTVNEIDKQLRNPNKGRVIQDVCETKTHRVVVDSVGDSKYRYRAWTKPHAISAVPDLEINSGTESIEGTDQCAHRVWTFTHGNATYIVSGIGCTTSSAPDDATGDLEVDINGTEKQDDWCE